MESEGGLGSRGGQRGIHGREEGGTTPTGKEESGTRELSQLRGSNSSEVNSEKGTCGPETS